MARFDAAVGRYIYLSIDGIEYRVYFEETGTGIPLLLQHTAGADGRQWRHLLEDPEVQQHYRMIAYDLPYHAKSLPPTSVAWWQEEYRLTRDFFIQVPLTLARELELDRPIFMGCSIGGHLAADLACYHPGVFRAVIALEGCNTQLFCPTTSSCCSAPWDDPALTLAQGLGCPRMRADPAPPAQSSSSRMHVERVPRCSPGGSAGIMGGRRPHVRWTPLVSADPIDNSWRPHCKSGRVIAQRGQRRGIMWSGILLRPREVSTPPTLHEPHEPCSQDPEASGEVRGNAPADESPRMIAHERAPALGRRALACTGVAPLRRVHADRSRRHS
jgi:pimeloyl-ACP methyl ester carboxylesterase